MNPMYDFEDIDDYLHDRMGASDRQVFEQALETDADLAQRLEALRAEAKVLRLLRNEYLLEQFATWETEDVEKKTTEAAIASTPGAAKVIPFYRRQWFVLAAAASLAGIVVAGIAFGWFDFNAAPIEVVKTDPVEHRDTTATQMPMPPLENKEVMAEKTPPTNKQVPQPPQVIPSYAALAREAYMDEDFNGTLMGAGDDEETEDNYTKAVKRYGEKKYADALALLIKLDSSQLQENLYLRGYVYYHLQKYEKAEQDFRVFRSFRVSDRKVDALWCEVFCLVPQLPASRNRLDAVLQEIIAKPGHAYYKRAVALQRALEK